MYIIYGLMIVIGLIAMYTLLNAGNPDSLLRPYLPDPRHDVYVAAVSSVLNADTIRELRKKGRSDEEIAISILAALGSASGYKHNLALKKLVVALSEFK